MIACSLTILIHILQENEPQKTQTLKSLVSYAWAAIFQNINFSQSPLKVINFSFFYFLNKKYVFPEV